MTEKKDIEIVDVKQVPVEYDLDAKIFNLLREEPFFARISRYVTKHATYSIPTAGVRINLETFNFELLYNPKFLASLPEEHVLGVLMHEFYHIALAHCTTRKVEGVDHKTQNIAADLAINGLPNMVGKLPDFCCFPGKGHFADYPAEKAFEWYLKQLLKDQKNNKEKGEKGEKGEGNDSSDGSGSDSFDDHSGWNEKDDSDDSFDNAKQVAAQKFKDIIQKAAQECDKDEYSGSANSGWGSVSQSIRKEIRASFEYKLDPKTVFSYFCKTSVRASRKHRITKINKRWQYIHPGRVFERRARIAIAVDQSGSVSDEMLTKIFSWMGDLAKFCEFTVVPFDDKVFEEKVYVWKKGEKRKRERVLCGGTNFDAPTVYVNKNDFDGLIIYTDMCAPAPVRCNVRRLWITDRYHAQHPMFTITEKVLVID